MEHRTPRLSAGFSLVEVLVGLGIGMIAILMMFRIVAMWETHSRTTASGSDAQVAGTLALFNLEREIKQAGQGIGRADPPFMGCPVAATDVPAARPFAFSMFPVDIIPGAAGAPDQINVMYGNSSFYVEEQVFRFSTATTKTTVRRGGFRPGDLAIVAGNETAAPGSATCALIQITAANNPDNVTLNHDAANYTNFYTGNIIPARYNPAGGTGGIFGAGRLYNLGPAPQLGVWTVTARGDLSRSELFGGGLPQAVAERVVNLKAEFGIDTNADRIPDVWTNAPVAPVDWTTVLAVRAAVLVRSKQFERTTDPAFATPLGVTLVAPTWAGGAFVMTNVDGTADGFGPTQDDPNNWRYYRYRVYERVIPLRNMLWGTAP